MTIALCTSVESAERFRSARIDELVLAKTAEDLGAMLQQDPGETAVVLGPEIAWDVATEVVQKLKREHPRTGIILVRDRLEVELLTKAMRLGIAEVVATSEAGLLAAAIRRVKADAGQALEPVWKRNRVGKLLLVFSAKGGTGKTTVATNLAVALADQPGKKACLVDLDLQFGDVAVALGLEPNRTISDAIRMEETFDQEGLAGLMTRHLSNLDVLLAPIDPSDIEFITARLVHRILRELKLKYDFVVVDCPPALTDLVLSAFDLADEYILLTTPDAPALKNLKVAMDALSKLGLKDQPWKVVMNRATARTGMSQSKVAGEIGQKVFAKLPDNNAVSQSLNRGQALVRWNPKNPVSTEIQRMAAAISGPLRPPLLEHFGMKRK